MSVCMRAIEVVPATRVAVAIVSFILESLA